MAPTIDCELAPHPSSGNQVAIYRAVVTNLENRRQAGQATARGRARRKQLDVRDQPCSRSARMLCRMEPIVASTAVGS